MFENVCLAIKVALDLNIDKKVIQKALPLLSFEGRFRNRPSKDSKGNAFWMTFLSILRSRATFIARQTFSNIPLE